MSGAIVSYQDRQFRCKEVTIDCPFCNFEKAEVLYQNEHAIAFKDRFPVSKGHTLVVPKQHVASFFSLSPEVQQSIWAFVSEIRYHISVELHPDSFNIGINDGWAAGQTISHAHIHVIPRYKGDVNDPKGGIRWVIPKKADYWHVQEPDHFMHKNKKLGLWGRFWFGDKKV